jgi:calcineurin-like phosphoesterase family protein
MTIFVVSDHHFGHANILKFLKIDGKTRVRPEFETVEEMNETMIQNHNKVVSDSDKVYFLGDIAFNNRVFHEVMPRLKGKKSLILGNHDHLKMDEYYKYFKNIYSARYLKHNDKYFVLCHYPMHPKTNYPNHPVCIHGHIHEKVIMTREAYLCESLYGPSIGYDEYEDTYYFNVSVERINYTPISLDEIASKV